MKNYFGKKIFTILNDFQFQLYFIDAGHPLGAKVASKT